MFQLTRKIEYSLIVLHHMATAKKEANPEQGSEALPLFTVKMIANRYGIPEMHTAKTFQILCKKGILSSKQGTKGGYRLAKPLETVTLYDLIEDIEGPFGIVRCTTTQTNNECNYSPFCNIVDPMQNLNLKLVNFYKNTTLKELLENPSPLPSPLNKEPKELRGPKLARQKQEIPV